MKKLLPLRQWQWKIAQRRLLVAAHVSGPDQNHLYWTRVFPWWPAVEVIVNGDKFT